MFLLLPFAFWIILLAFILLTASSAYENHWTAAMVLLGTFIGLKYLADFSIIAWVQENPSFLYFIPVYFVAGGLWSILKWYLFVKEKFFEIKEEYEKECEYNRNWHKRFNENDPRKKEEKTFAQYVTSGKLQPEAGKNRDKIIFWINYWPVSIFWTFLHEVFEKLAIRIFNAIRGVYDRIVKSVFPLEEKEVGD